MHSHKRTTIKPWVVSVDMGYGHQRAAYPLRRLAHTGKIITANTYDGIPARDFTLWQESRRVYELISRFKRYPLIGPITWNLFDYFQQIDAFYPKRDLSKPTLQLRQTYRLIEKKQWGRHLIERLAADPRPLVTTFFIPAFMAETFGYPGEIYCLATDTDISRAWAPKYPAKSTIKYFAPNYRVVERLKLYGVAEENIFLTGFPLPPENTGNRLATLKKDIAGRLVNLDPRRKYWSLYKETIRQHLGIAQLPKKADHVLTLMFAVGGAGAQREIGAEIIVALKQKIKNRRIKLVLVAGIHNAVSKYFLDAAASAGLEGEIGRGIQIIAAEDKMDYFRRFNEALRTTDVLWTKPSELSFYTALGVPLIIAPPIGSQEEFNRKWIRTIGSGASQFEARHCDQWIFDWVESGWLAEAAMNGFIEAPKFGTQNIEYIVSHQFDRAHEPEMVLQY